MVQHRPLAAKALEFMGEARPDIIMADSDMQGMNGLVFLKSAQQLLGSLPPAVLLVPQDLSDADQARLEVQKVRWTLRKPVAPEGLKRVIEAVLQYEAPPSMNVVEVLATGYTDMSERLVKLQAEGHELVLYLGQGQLWAVQHPAFIQGYVRKVAPDAPAYLAAPQDLGALAQQESGPGATPAMAELKQQVCLSLFASIAPDEEFTVQAESLTLPPGLVPVDLVNLLGQLVDHLPEAMLAGLKRPRVKVHTGGSKVPGDPRPTPATAICSPFAPHRCSWNSSSPRASCQRGNSCPACTFSCCSATSRSSPRSRAFFVWRGSGARSRRTLKLSADSPER